MIPKDDILLIFSYCDFFNILFYLDILYYSLGRRFVDVQELDSFVPVWQSTVKDSNFTS